MVGTYGFPVAPQQIEKFGGEHDVAILPGLSLLDPKHHSLTVDVGHTQTDEFRDP